MKSRSAWIAGLVLVGLFAATVAVTPRPLDRRVRLEREGDAPFDAEVFHALLPGLLGPVEDVAVTPYERLADTSLVGTTYVLLAQSVAPDAAEASRLLRYVARGNTVVLAANVIEGPLSHALGTADSLDDGRRGLRTDWAEEIPFLSRGSLAPDTLRLVAPGVTGDYGFPVAVQTATLQGLDSSRSVVRGIATETFGPGAVVVAVVPWEHGRFVVSSTPLAFTNAALTGDGDAARFVGAVLADVPRGPVLWDDSAKPYRSHAETPLRFVLQTPALRWAYALLLVSGLLFVAFRGRRWQRAIPEIAPPPNAQREFARTVGRLHLVAGDTPALVRRKARTLLDRAERDLRLAGADLSDDTARRIARRTDTPEADALALFARLRQLSVDAATPRELLALDRHIDALFARAAEPPVRSVHRLQFKHDANSPPQVRGTVGSPVSDGAAGAMGEPTGGSERKAQHPEQDSPTAP